MTLYAFTVELATDVAGAIARLSEALKEERLGVVSDVNVQGILQAKLGEDVGGYRILGVCAADLARRVIASEPDAGVLLPCTAVVRDGGDGKSVIAFMDPATMLGVTGNPALQEVAAEARRRLDAVVARLGA